MTVWQFLAVLSASMPDMAASSTAFWWHWKWRWADLNPRLSLQRYDHRRTGTARSRGWLHYAGLGRLLVVSGAHASSSADHRIWCEFGIMWEGRTALQVYIGTFRPKIWRVFIHSHGRHG